MVYDGGHDGYPLTVRERLLRQLRTMCQRHDEELRAMIAKAASAGARSQDIADALGVSRATVWRRYGDQVRRTHEDGS